MGVSSPGQNSVEVVPSMMITFSGGYASLTNFSISHPGSDYILIFTIIDPPVGFMAQTTTPFDVSERQMVIRIFEAP